MTTSAFADLNALRDAATRELDAAVDAAALEAWRVAYLGRSGKITGVLRGIAAVPADQRRVFGAAANEIKVALEQRFEARQADLERGALSALASDAIDITLPGRPVDMGRLHPTTIVIREICGIFQSMGFQVVEGPEVEWDKYNFEALNIPKDHPARDKWDTIWVDANKDVEGRFTTLLRTHNSPMQARVMETNQPPIRVVVPGKCFRYEATDATHESQFFQVEGLVVDEGVSFANLKHTLYEFARRLFGGDRKVRFRCDFFPFVEPGVDMSIDCFKCGGRDPACRICRGSGWIEIMGAGMVHPNVLRNVGYDPARVSGFAFGMGPERIAMLKYGIDDIRLFYANDIRFLRQF
ncbi:MAG: phenylalanine--tRNA ligase subunit alpha [SAR202 cluster bacterium]|nr:phenylalanine--tRNA ligase subunit alpha [SAR202 cluster bacterium]